MSKDGRESFIPALKYRWLTPLYDSLISMTLPEETIKGELIRRASIQDGDHILDVGCGSGTLMLMIKKVHPEATVWGLDADKEIIRRAKDKASKERLPLFFHRQSATEMDYPDATFNRVVSSLFFHHLRREDKIKTLKECHRVLRAGGAIHIADWGRPHDVLMRLAFFLVQALDGFETTADNVEGSLPAMLEEAGFKSVEEVLRYRTIFGTLALYSGTKP